MDQLKLRNELLTMAEKRQAEAIKEGHHDAWLIGLARSHALIDMAECIALAVKEPQP
jgi:hypothetical protein